MAQPPSNSPASDFAVALLGEFIASGVRDVVLSPGSRSQALALVAAEFERMGLIRLRVRIDERVAGFLALGLAVETNAPVLVITTSGTAVANLHPAVLEAHHSGVPLIVITADRPEELRGIGSNQTTQQPGIFGAAATLIDVEAPTAETEKDAAAAVARRALGSVSPVHLNVAFREPLSAGLPELASPLERVEPVETSQSVTQGEVAERVEPVEASPGVTRGEIAERVEPVETSPGVTQGEISTSSIHFGETSPSVTQGEIAERVEPVETSQSVTRGEISTGSIHSVEGAVDIAPAPGTVVIAGHASGEIAEATARALGAPLLAEVSSGAHFGPNLVVDYRTLVNAPGFGDRIERVIVFGHPTLSREVPALIQRPGVESIVVRGRNPEPYNPGHAVTAFAPAVNVVGEPDTSREARAWLGSWVTTSRNALEQHDAPPIEIAVSNAPRDQAAFNRAVIAGLRAPVDRRALVESVWRMTWPHDRLVLGASRLIREADRFVPGKRISVHANRGLAGIDGTIGTGIGIALASQAQEGATQGGVTRVLLGDLTLLHDVGSLLFGTGEPRPRIQVIVGNDGGGTIFEGLEVAGTTDAAPFERVMLTPQRVDLQALAAAYGWEYRLAATRGDLDAALAAGPGPTLIEVPLAP